MLDGKYKCINCQILIQSPEKNFHVAWCYTFWETLFLGEGTDLQVTFLEMNYMSYVYYVDDHQEWGGVQTTFAPHSSYRDNFMI